MPLELSESRKETEPAKTKKDLPSTLSLEKTDEEIIFGELVKPTTEKEQKNRETNEEGEEMEFNQETEQKLLETAREIGRRFESVVRGQEKELLDPQISYVVRVRSFAAALKKIWPENDGNPRAPSFELSSVNRELADIQFVFNPNSDEGETADIGGVVKEVKIGVKNLLTAKTLEQFETALETALIKIHHEIEHIKYPGIDEGEGIEGTINYLTNPGEIRAHAVQFAFKYQRRFPNEPFTLERVQSICESNKEINYFIGFNNPIKQEQYGSFGDLAKAHRQVVWLTKKFLDLMHTN